MCTESIDETHGHLVDLEVRNLMCACRGCYLLFTSDGAGGRRYRAVPDRYLAFTDFRLSPAQWDSLQIPVSVAFFFLNSTLERVAAFYPGPAGATESLLPLGTWDEVVDANPALATLAPDVEAFLVRADRESGGAECFLVPIDACYELVGHLRPPLEGLRRRARGSRRPRRLLRACAGEGAMTNLALEVIDARPEPHAAVPTIMLRMRIAETTGATVHAIALRCQIRIEPQRRRYTADEEARLYELFGETPRWGDSLRPFLWTHVATTVTSFRGTTEIDLPIVCTYDFEVAASKYLHAVEDGEIPILLLFTGTVFTKGQSGFAVEPVAWDLEAPFRLPVAVWRDTMDLYFPNSGWIRVSRGTLDALQRYKSGRALPTWDQAFEHLLKQAGEDGA